MPENTDWHPRGRRNQRERLSVVKRSKIGDSSRICQCTRRLDKLLVGFTLDFHRSNHLLKFLFVFLRQNNKSSQTPRWKAVNQETSRGNHCKLFVIVLSFAFSPIRILSEWNSCRNCTSLTWCSVLSLYAAEAVTFDPVSTNESASTKTNQDRA